MKVVVLGGTGMLGSMVVDVLSQVAEVKTVATARTSSALDFCRSRLPQVEWKLYDAADAGEQKLGELINDAQWIINAIGIIKPYIHDDCLSEVREAVNINALFPYRLASAVASLKTRVLQIATDCVYDGTMGNYDESSLHNALDVYGKTKSLGEVPSERFHCLRCSIIGPEPRTHASLLEWFRGQPNKAELKGFNNHRWNGVTTLHFAKICRGIILSAMDLPRCQHIIPAQHVTKYELLTLFAKHFKRDDLIIKPVEAPHGVDRTLQTKNKSLNQKIWNNAGYPTPPTISEMIQEIAVYDFHLTNLKVQNGE